MSTKTFRIVIVIRYIDFFCHCEERSNLKSNKILYKIVSFLAMTGGRNCHLFVCLKICFREPLAMTSKWN